MKKFILSFLFLILSFSIFSQDIVYDSLRGNKTNFRRIKWGPSEITNSIWYENEGIICRSKVLLCARVFDGLVREQDFSLIYFPFPTDLVISEFKTSGPINLVVYKYYGPVDTIYYIGLRKAPLGSDIFTGKYLLVDPLIKNSTINIYNGIGSNRKLFLSLKENEMTDNNIRDYVMSDQVTVENLNGTNLRLIPAIKEFIDVDTAKTDIKIWPNPVSTILNMLIPENTGIIVRIYDYKSSLLYEEHVTSETGFFDFSQYKIGMYIVVVTDYNIGNILTVFKVIKR